MARRWMRKMEAQRATGVIDFGGHRCSVYGYMGPSLAMLAIEERIWQGEPGSAADTLSAGTVSANQPVWLVDVVRGVVDAEEKAAEGIDGRRCRRFAAHVDLNRAAELAGYHMAVPPGIQGLGDLIRIPVEVWVDDDGFIRRIRHISGEPKAQFFTSTLNLIDFGVEPPSDWSRLPSHPMGRRID